MAQPVVYFESVAQAPERMRTYFAELFGWEIDDGDNELNYAMVGRNTNSEGVGIGPAWEGYAGPATFYVQVDDVEAALVRAEQLGARRLMGPRPVPGGDTVIGYMADPEGHVIGISNMA
jgi:predicted enzyme related to lactoylglutathione lyase